MIFHALKPELLELPGTLQDVNGILLHSKQNCLHLSKSKAFLFAALDRHAYAYKKTEGMSLWYELWYMPTWDVDNTPSNFKV